MKRADQVTGTVLLLLSGAMLFESTRLPMAYGAGPGSGFLPFWLSLVLAGLSLLLLVGARRGAPQSGEDEKIGWPQGRGLAWIAAAIAGLMAYTYLTSLVGYLPATFAFVGLMIRLLGSYRWYQSGALGIAVALASYLMFQVWLGMPLPTGRFSIL